MSYQSNDKISLMLYIQKHAKIENVDVTTKGHFIQQATTGNCWTDKEIFWGAGEATEDRDNMNQSNRKHERHHHRT